MTRTLFRATGAAKLKNYTASTVLVIDEFGLLPIRDRDVARTFFHVVNTRHVKRHPTTVTTNYGLSRLGRILGDGRRHRGRGG
jgi:DNA replication protein DnaC